MITSPLQITLTFDSMSEYEFMMDRIRVAEDDWRTQIKSNDILDLGLTVRSQRCLTAAGIVSISALIQMGPEQTAKIPTLGRRSLQEIAIQLIDLKYVAPDGFWEKARR